MISITGNTVTNVEIVSFDPGRSPYVHLQVSLLYALTLNSTGSQWVAVVSGVAATASKGFPLQNTGSKTMCCHKAIIVTQNAVILDGHHNILLF